MESRYSRGINWCIQL